MLQRDKSALRQRMIKDPLKARREYAGPAIFSYGFRPFFFSGALWAALSVPIWIYAYTAGDGMIGGAPALTWHIHEMLFGFLSAVIAGFLLTAVPNWTGGLPVLGGRLMALFALWAAGRLAMFVYGVWPLPVAIIDSAFLVVLTALMWREVLTGGNWKNAPVCGLASVFALANIGFHLGGETPWLQGFAQNAAIAAVAVLITLIGGRIIPSFTRNWLVQKGEERLPAQFGGVDRAVLLLTVLSLIAWIAYPRDSLTGMALLTTGFLHLLRLARWRGWRTSAEPLVLILHLGYLWLPIAFVLMGAAVLAPSAIPPSAALHALTAGAMGTMTLAVMTRATLGHTGRPRTADVWTVIIYALVLFGALVRVTGPALTPSHSVMSVAVAAMLWSAAFALFSIRYAPMLWCPRGQ